MINDYIKLSLRDDVIILDSIDSTNTFISEKLRTSQSSDGTLAVVSDSQTGGRGRFSRSFYSPSGTGIYMSYAFRSNMADNELLHVTPVTAAILHKELAPFSDSLLQIKWVNDLYNSSGKIAGILTELHQIGDSRWIVIGVGINVSSPEDFPPELHGILGHLSDNALSRDVIACKILDSFARIFRPEALSLPSMHDYYRSHCLSIGCDVTVNPVGSSEYTAHSIDINDSYELLVVPDGSDEIVAISSGEVSVSV